MASRDEDDGQEYDVVVIGAGAAGMAAAAVAATGGLRAIVIEKTGVVGGTTAISGGMVWVPNTEKRPPDAEDSPEQAAAYLEAVIGSDQGADLRRHYLAKAPEAIAYLERHTRLRLAPVPFYPDYYPELPGATLKGRVLEPVPFDARELGTWFPLLRPPLPEFMLFGGMMVARADVAHFRNAFKSFGSMRRVLRLLARYGAERVRHHRGTTLVLGNALAGRLLKSLLDLGVPVHVGTPARGLIVDAGRVAGVEVQPAGGKPTVLRARRGVVLAAGGFSHNRVLRRQLLPGEAADGSAAADGNTGDGLELGVAAGGSVAAGANNAFWTPVSKFTRPDGRPVIFPHTVTDRGKPGMFAVGKTGMRFTNEANSYHEFVLAMLRAKDAIPAYLVCDRRALWTYGLGAIKPMTLRLDGYRRSGYLVEAPTIRALAAKLGVDASNLETTVATYNRDAASGVDTAFGRGSNAYHKYVGDAANRPNPCMRPIEAAPFYAIALFPADLGTASGLLTSADGEVLDGAGRPIGGLYACGNDMNSIMCGSYPGPGITLGPALVFAYLVASRMLNSQPG